MAWELFIRSNPLSLWDSVGKRREEVEGGKGEEQIEDEVFSLFSFRLSLSPLPPMCLQIERERERRQTVPLTGRKKRADVFVVLLSKVAF